ncbi:carbohydrate-binding module family 18 protein, partial [Trematosphaeria pertusa]
MSQASGQANIDLGALLSALGVVQASPSTSSGFVVSSSTRIPSSEASEPSITSTATHSQVSSIPIVVPVQPSERPIIDLAQLLSVLGVSSGLVLSSSATGISTGTAPLSPGSSASIPIPEPTNLDFTTPSSLQPSSTLRADSPLIDIGLSLDLLEGLCPGPSCRTSFALPSISDLPLSSAGTTSSGSQNSIQPASTSNGNPPLVDINLSLGLLEFPCPGPSCSSSTVSPSLTIPPTTTPGSSTLRSVSGPSPAPSIQETRPLVDLNLSLGLLEGLCPGPSCRLTAIGTSTSVVSSSFQTSTLSSPTRPLSSSGPTPSTTSTRNPPLLDVNLSSGLLEGLCPGPSCRSSTIGATEPIHSSSSYIPSQSVSVSNPALTTLFSSGNPNPSSTPSVNPPLIDISLSLGLLEGLCPGPFCRSSNTDKGSTFVSRPIVSLPVSSTSIISLNPGIVTSASPPTTRTQPLIDLSLSLGLLEGLCPGPSCYSSTPIGASTPTSLSGSYASITSLTTTAIAPSIAVSSSTTARTDPPLIDVNLSFGLLEGLCPGPSCRSTSPSASLSGGTTAMLSPSVSLTATTSQEISPATSRQVSTPPPPFIDINLSLGLLGQRTSSPSTLVSQVSSPSGGSVSGVSTSSTLATTSFSPSGISSSDSTPVSTPPESSHTVITQTRTTSTNPPLIDINLSLGLLDGLCPGPSCASSSTLRSSGPLASSVISASSGWVPISGTSSLLSPTPPSTQPRPLIDVSLSLGLLEGLCPGPFCRSSSPGSVNGLPVATSSAIPQPPSTTTVPQATAIVSTITSTNPPLVDINLSLGLLEGLCPGPSCRSSSSIGTTILPGSPSSFTSSTSTARANPSISSFPVISSPSATTLPLIDINLSLGILENLCPGTSCRSSSTTSRASGSLAWTSSELQLSATRSSATFASFSSISSSSTRGPLIDINLSLGVLETLCSGPFCRSSSTTNAPASTAPTTLSPSIISSSGLGSSLAPTTTSGGSMLSSLSITTRPSASASRAAVPPLIDISLSLGILDGLCPGPSCLPSSTSAGPSSSDRITSTLLGTASQTSQWPQSSSTTLSQETSSSARATSSLLTILSTRPVTSSQRLPPFIDVNLSLGILDGLCPGPSCHSSTSSPWTTSVISAATSPPALPPLLDLSLSLGLLEGLCPGPSCRSSSTGSPVVMPGGPSSSNSMGISLSPMPGSTPAQTTSARAPNILDLLDFLIPSTSSTSSSIGSSSAAALSPNSASIGASSTILTSDDSGAASPLTTARSTTSPLPTAQTSTQSSLRTNPSSSQIASPANTALATSSSASSSTSPAISGLSISRTSSPVVQPSTTNSPARTTQPVSSTPTPSQAPRTCCGVTAGQEYTSSSSTYEAQCGTNHPLGDMQQLLLMNFGQCVQRCIANPLCVAIVYNPLLGMCSLKSTIGASQVASGYCAMLKRSVAPSGQSTTALSSQPGTEGMPSPLSTQRQSIIPQTSQSAVVGGVPYSTTGSAYTSGSTSTNLNAPVLPLASSPASESSNGPAQNSPTTVGPSSASTADTRRPGASSPSATSSLSFPRPVLRVSPNGLCGSFFGYTCLSSNFGQCCGRSGICGDGSESCGAGCMSEYGLCESESSSPILSTPPQASISEPNPPVQSSASSLPSRTPVFPNPPTNPIPETSPHNPNAPSAAPSSEIPGIPIPRPPSSVESSSATLIEVLETPSRPNVPGTPNPPNQPEHTSPVSQPTPPPRTNSAAPTEVAPPLNGPTTSAPRAPDIPTRPAPPPGENNGNPETLSSQSSTSQPPISTPPTPADEGIAPSIPSPAPKPDRPRPRPYLPYPWPDPSEGGDGVDSDGSDYWDGSGDEDGSNDDGEDCSCAWTSSSEKDATDDDEPAPPTPTVPECDVRATVTSTVYPPWFTSDGYYSASDDDTAEESMLESELGGPRRRPRHGWMHDWWRGLSHLFWGDGGE